MDRHGIKFYAAGFAIELGCGQQRHKDGKYNPLEEDSGAPFYGDF